jgi:hypothetical protein
MYSPTYLDATQLVTNAGELRLSQDAINKITPAVVSLMTAGGSIQATVLAAAQSLGGGTFTINSLSFGNPTITPTLVQGGVEVVIDVPSLDIDVDVPVFGSTQVSSTDAHFDATMDLSVVGGAIVATMPNAPLVTLNGFSSSNLIVSGLGAIAISPLLSSAIQGALPAAVTAALATASQPIARTFMGYTATARVAPQSLAIVPPNFIAAGDANVTIAPPAGTTFTANPAASAPGSPSRAGAGSTAPDFSATTHDVSLALREDMINRVLYAAWACRGGGARIDQAWLTAHGVALPFALDASILVPFFPGLAALNPGGGPMPLAFVVEADLPPVVVLTGTPSLVTFEAGEVRVGVQVDLGQGFVDLMTLSVSAQIGASIAIANSQAQLSLGQPVAVTVDLVANPLGVSLPDIDQFVQNLLPVALTYAGGLIPPVPIPALPAGLTLTNVDLSVGGTGADFLVIDGDL